MLPKVRDRYDTRHVTKKKSHQHLLDGRELDVRFMEGYRANERGVLSNKVVY